MDHDPYFDPPPSGGEDYAMHPGPPPHRSDEHPPLPAGPAPGDQVGSKRQRSPPRYDRYDRDPHDRGSDFARDRSPRRRRFDGPPGGGFPEGRRVVVRGRGRGRGAARDDEPLSFREFCVRHVSDAATPAEAEHRYEQYKRDHAEAFRRRDFERFARDDPKVRAAHDPRAIEEAIERRAEMARDAAREFEEDLAAGKVAPLPPAGSSLLESKDAPPEEPSSGGDADAPMASSNAPTEGTDALFRQKRKDARGRWPVPDAAWAPERLALDLRRLEALAKALDEEKRVRTFDDAPGTEKKADDVFRDAEDVTRALDGVSDVSDVTEETLDLLDLLAAAVDRRVVYLWRVHGVDYYAGAELPADEYVARPPSARSGEGEGCLARGERPGAEALSGVARAFAEEQKAHADAERESRVGGEQKRAEEKAEDAAPKPEDGAAEDGEDKDTVLVANSNATSNATKPTRVTNASSPASKWASRVDRCWRVRLEQGDASWARAGRDVVERELEAWKRSCVVQHEENRFGCTLSSKMFVAPEFVLKHINVKQADAVNRQRDVILDRLFLENYLAARRDEEKSARREKRAERRAKGDEGRGGARAGRAAKQEMRALAKSIVKDKEGQGLGGKDGAPKAGKSYNDLDAPKVDRVVLDYGDI
jgi:hypothetical protein